MGNWWSGAQQPSKVRYEVVLPTGARAWELLYSGDIDTWDAVAARYGMDKFAYCCGLTSCDREAVCLRYIKATLQSDKHAITIERYKASSVHIPLSTCPAVRPLLSEGFRLNEVAVAERGHLVLLVLNQARDYISQVAFPLIHLHTDSHDIVEKKKETEKPRLLRRLSSKRDMLGESRKRPSGSDAQGCDGRQVTRGGGERRVRQDKVTGRCMGVLQAPHKDMTIISCHISPDLSQTAVMFYSLSSSTGTFCYTLHFYCNLSLQQEAASPGHQEAVSSGQHKSVSSGQAAASSHSQSVTQDTSALSPEQRTPHLLQTVKLSREVQPYFVYDPRYCSTRIAVANYECRDTGIAHELVVLSLDRGGGSGGKGEKDARVVKRGKLSLPALFGNSRFSLLYSKDGELIILQKLTDDRFGVTSFCDIYIFHADELTLIKYMTASLPGLFHICKVSYQPVFSRCGSFMRVLDHRVSNSSSDGQESDEYTVVQIYQLPRSLSLLSQCRRVILQQVAHCHFVSALPLPHKLKEYLRFGPIY